MTKNYETVSEAVNDLVKRGYEVNFTVHAEEECLMCDQISLCLSPEEFEIHETYRFEGTTDPADEAVVFAVCAPKHQLKGIVIDAFGTYSDAKTSKILQRLPTNL